MACHRHRGVGWHGVGLGSRLVLPDQDKSLVHDFVAEAIASYQAILLRYDKQTQI